MGDHHLSRFVVLASKFGRWKMADAHGSFPTHDLQQADADDRGFGVAAVAETVAEPGTDGHDVLEGATKLHADRVLHGAHAEAWLHR